MRLESLLLSCLVAATACAGPATTVQIFTDRNSPQAVGTVNGVSAVGKDEGEPEKYMPLLRYRFSVAEQGDTFRIVSDFNQNSEFAWRPELYEHDARLKVTVLNTKTKLTTDQEITFRIDPRAPGKNSVTIHTSHP